jgi:hypothetical protein
MPTFRLEIRQDNAAFADVGLETARILRDLADKIQSMNVPGGFLFDVNGARVGEYGTEE